MWTLMRFAMKKPITIWCLTLVGFRLADNMQSQYTYRIKDQKVWIEWDGTDEEIAQQLIDAGIKEEDMVFSSSENLAQETVKLAA